jgi:LuxR family maltose regulon positive regulatory protein
MERRLAPTMPLAELAAPSGLVWSKLIPPTPRPGLIARPGLQSLLDAGLGAKLCLLDAPAGSGKTTLLAQWCATTRAGQVAWVSLDEGDNDPARLWSYISEALRSVQPGVGAAALEALDRAGVDYGRVVLPSLLNDLRGIGSPLVLVLDDFHLVTDPTCHHTVAFFLQHLPASVHLLLATRVDPPLPLAGMRARGELAELRRAELQFSDEEADALLNGAMGLELAPGDAARLAERTEGWAAGLYLAGLSLRGRGDPGAFITAFSGDHRHVADYLAAEVLARQPEHVRTFLLGSSILRRLSGPLCDELLEREGSAELLEELEQSNLFLVPLDDHRDWYRYHQLFGQLLRLELGSRQPDLVRALHRRAADWHRRGGDVEEAIYHATAAGELADAGALIAANWLAYWRLGRRATVSRWVDRLPDEAVTADPPVAFVAAWIGGYSGASKQQSERWLAVVEAADWRGPLPDGISSLPFGAALARAAVPFDEVGRALEAARRALELAGPDRSSFHWMAQAALGHVLYLSGRPAEAREALEELVERVSAARQPYAVMIGLAVLSLLATDEGDDQAAGATADRAMAIAEAQERLEWSLGLFGTDGMALHRAHALLLLAAVRRGLGDLPGAHHLRGHAQELIGQLADPGMLPSLLEQSSPTQRAPHRRAQVAAPLTRRELAVLRLLPTGLSTREIGDQLHVSVNTIRSQVQAVYRKLEVTGRHEAVTRARRLGLLPESIPDSGAISPR